MRVKLAAALVLMLLLTYLGQASASQTGAGHTLFGDVTVDESQVEGLKPMSFEIILYTDGGRVVARQTVTSNGRYRFIAVPNGNYDVVVELENQEIARLHFSLFSAFKNDFRRDIQLQWRSVSNRISNSAKTISAEDIYDRSSVNQARFEKAQEAFDKKEYDKAASLFTQLVDDDEKDFQAWTELGTVRLSLKKTDEAEKAYLKAIEVRPTFFLALMNLGRVRITAKNFEGAIESLSKAVEVRPQSAEANYLLGESYLQIKKGSKAVGYLNEALKLDPIGKADVHLRLAALYSAAGMKDKAADEYEAFLKKKPDHPDRKKLEQYITQNKKS